MRSTIQAGIWSSFRRSTERLPSPGRPTSPPLQASTQSAQAEAPAASKAAINLNLATLEQLETLPGIGPKVAGRIVEHRTKNGNFKRIEELMNVKGIGEKNFGKLEAHITAGEAPKSASR